MSTTVHGARQVLPRPTISPLSPRAGALTALLVAIVCFGSSTVASKAVIDHLPPLTLAFARFAIALMVLLLMCHRTGVRPVIGPMEALLGLTGIAVPFALQNLALQFAGAGETTLIIEGAIPIATALLGAPLLGERLTGFRITGLLLAVTGVGAIFLKDGVGGGSTAMGGLLALGAGVSFAVYTVVGRKMFGGGASLGVLTGSIAAGVLLLAPCAAVESVVAGPGTIAAADGLILLYLGVGGSALTQLLWARGLAGLEATEVAIIGTLMPVVGVASAALFLGESVGPGQIAGGIVVAAGLFVTTRAARPRSVTSNAAIEPRQPLVVSRGGGRWRPT